MCKLRTLFHGLVLGLTILTFMSCEMTYSDVCPMGDHPHRSGITFTYEWNEEYEAVKPDTMYVLANRVFNSWKCGMAVSSTSGKGRYLFNAPPPKEPAKPVTPPVADEGNSGEEDTPEDENTPSEDETPEETTPEGGSEEDSTPDSEVVPAWANVGTRAQSNNVSTFKVLNGTYKMLTFNLDSTSLVYHNLEQFINPEGDEYKTLQDIDIAYRAYKLTDEKLNKITDSWYDYNPYTDYIQPEMPAVFFDTIVKKEILASGTYPCEFSPVPLTQRITIKFNIQKGGDVKFAVDSVFAEMSGIPYKINLSNGYVDYSKTYKMLFHMDVEDSPNAKTALCSGIINVTSLIGSTDADMEMGPGIMCVRVYTSAFDENGNKKRKAIQGKINFTDVINDAKLMEFTADGEHVRRSKTHATLTMREMVMIDGNKILSNPSGDAVGNWIQCSDIIVDI